tara:strand:- start:1771 stop:2613 length:843 start_codon:yes stop_codon:yes gene_type:complete
MESIADRSNLHLDLCLKSRRDRTFIDRQYSRHPFHICKPLYVDDHPGGMATVYVQSSAGGIFAGDRLRVRVFAQPDSQVHLTSQASTVVHRMTGSNASLETLVHIEEGALVEFLPDPLILFPESDLTSRLTVRLDGASTAIFCDSFLMYDPYHQGKYFSKFTNETSVFSGDGELLCRDRTSVSGSEIARKTIGIMGLNAVVGTFYYLRPGEDPGRMCEQLNETAKKVSGSYVGVSVLPNEIGVWARIVAAEVADLRQTIECLWAAAREDITGSKPSKRRK